MPFLNLDLDYFDHPKTRRLIGLLGRGAEVLPIKLWCYSGKYHAENGKLSDYSPKEIESTLGWWGKEGEAVEALVKLGFLESQENGYKVHDWKDHQGHIDALKKRNRKVALNRWENMRNGLFSEDTNGIPKSTSGMPQSNPFQSLPDQKETTAPGPKPPGEAASKNGVKPYVMNGPGQQVVGAYKILTGEDLEDRDWDRTYYPRFKKQAEDLLKFFRGNVETCCQCMEGIKKWAESRKIDWTLDTCVKRAADWRSGRLWKNG